MSYPYVVESKVLTDSTEYHSVLRLILLSKEGARAEPPVALLRMDTLTSGSTEVESNSEEDSSRGHLDGPTLSVRTMAQ